MMRHGGKTRSVLVVDPNTATAAQLCRLVSELGFGVASCSRYAEALERLEREAAAVVVCALVLPDASGIDLLGSLERLWPGMPVIMLAENASLSEAMVALRAGAADVLQKPLEPEEVAFVINKALTSVEMRAEHPPPPSSHERTGIIGDSSTMKQVYATLERAAQGTATVLVRGESGTGKELAARAARYLTARQVPLRQDRLRRAAGELARERAIRIRKRRLRRRYLAQARPHRAR